MPRKRQEPSRAMKSFFGKWLVEQSTPKPKKRKQAHRHESFPTPPASVASDLSYTSKDSALSLAGASDVSTVFQVPDTPSARSEQSEQSDISELSLAIPRDQVDKDGFAIPRQKRGKGVNKSKRAGLQFPVARFAKLIKTGGYARRATTDAAVYMTAVIEYLTAELLEVCGTIAVEMGQRHIRARHLKLGLRNDVELGAAVTDSSGHRKSRASTPMVAVNNEEMPEPGDALRKGPAMYKRPPSSSESTRKNSVSLVHVNNSTPAPSSAKRRRPDSAGSGQRTIQDFFGTQPRPKKARVESEDTKMRQSSIQSFFVKAGKPSKVHGSTRCTRRSSMLNAPKAEQQVPPDSPRLADLIKQNAALSINTPGVLGKPRRNLRGIRSMRKGLAQGQRRSLGHTDSLFTPAVSGQRSAAPAASPGPPVATPLPFRVQKTPFQSPATRILGTGKAALDLGVIKSWQPKADPNAQIGYINRLKKRPCNVQESSDGFAEGDRKENSEPTEMDLVLQAGVFGMDAERNVLETPAPPDVYH